MASRVEQDMLDPKNTRFFRKTLRQFATLQHQGPEASGAVVPFPADWFDISHDRLADFGAMTFLASLTTYHREKPLARALHYLEPPLRLGQYKLFRSNGFPRAFITWAGLSREAELAFAVEHRPLASQDWTSGSSVWLIDFAAPFGHFAQMLPLLTQNRELRRVRALWHNAAGEKYRIVQWSRETAEGAISVRSYGVNQFHRLLREEG